MNLPEYKDIRLRKTLNGKHEVFDILRHRYIALTPEEWVRQHFVNYLITKKGYPGALLANEVELRVGDKVRLLMAFLFVVVSLLSRRRCANGAFA